MGHIINIIIGRMILGNIGAYLRKFWNLIIGAEHRDKIDGEGFINRIIGLALILIVLYIAIWLF